jgi:PAS domain S-box-containing protein
VRLDHDRPDPTASPASSGSTADAASGERSRPPVDQPGDPSDRHPTDLPADEGEARLASERGAARLRRLQSVTASLTNPLTLDQVGQVSMDAGVAATGAASAQLCLLSDDGRWLEPVGVRGDAGARRDPWRRIPVEGQDPLARALRAGTPLFLAASEVASPDARAIGHAVAALPLMARGRAFGVLAFGFDRPHPPREEDRDFLIAVTYQCAQALERARLYEAERSAHVRVTQLLDSTSDALVAVDPEWRVLFVNRAAATMVAREPSQLVGSVIWDFFPEQADAPLARRLRQAMRERVRVDGELYAHAFQAWVEYRGFPSDEGMLLAFRDVTQRRLEEERARLLASASRVLATSRELGDALHGVVRLVVPDFASAAAIDLATEARALHRASRADVDEARALLPDEGAMSVPGHARLIVLPLAVGGENLGRLLLTRDAGRRRFGTSDRACAEELAQRVAAAVHAVRLHETERHLRTEAEAANRAKSDFLAVMSHELRTPLTAIVGYTELLADEVVGSITPLQRDHLGRIRASSEHLLMLIEDILSYSRLEAAQEVLHPEPFQVDPLVRQVESMLRPLAQKRGLALRVEADCGNARMHSDPQKVRQILINLAANAIKFTERGEIGLRAEVDGALVRFSVCDTGPGIAPEHVSRVFDAFWQADQRMTRRAGGAGLGLSVARQLARRLGGDVTLASTVGKGSVFTVTLPRELAA